MLLFKFKIIILFLLSSQLALAGIDGFSCLQSEFSATVSHKGFPFGLTQNILKLNKKNCELTLEHQKLKFMKKKWLVDVCRAPVHIKSGASGEIEVIKKKFTCGTDAKSKDDSFCKTLVLIEQIIQDDGLIFAKGEKENVSSEHGKIYCTYVLLRSYLRFDKVLSRTDTELSFDLENPLKKMVNENIEISHGELRTEPAQNTAPVLNQNKENVDNVYKDPENTGPSNNPTQENSMAPASSTAIPTTKEIGTF